MIDSSRQEVAKEEEPVVIAQSRSNLAAGTNLAQVD